jgi:hypothetical protein
MRVTLLIPAHNEAVVIAPSSRTRWRSTIRATDWRSGAVGWIDRRHRRIVRRYADRGIALQRIEPRGGKPERVNRGVARADGDVLVLCDANTMFAPMRCAGWSGTSPIPRVGAVSGDVRLRSMRRLVRAGRGAAATASSASCKASESRLWTAIGVDGGMFAIRHSLYVPNRPDTLIDDFVIAMTVAKAGRRVIYDPEAVADRGRRAGSRTGDAPAHPNHGRRLSEPARRAGRSARGTAAAVARLPVHKGLRWLSAFVLALMFAANLDRRAGSVTYAVVLVLHLGFYALALAGIRLHRRAMPAHRVPAVFLLPDQRRVARRLLALVAPLAAGHLGQADRQVAGRLDPALARPSHHR